jgi:hypothetical protein
MPWIVKYRLAGEMPNSTSEKKRRLLLRKVWMNGLVKATA